MMDDARRTVARLGGVTAGMQVESLLDFGPGAPFFGTVVEVEDGKAIVVANHDPSVRRVEPIEQFWSRYQRAWDEPNLRPTIEEVEVTWEPESER